MAIYVYTICLYIHSFVHLFVHSSIYLFIYVCIYLFCIHLFLQFICLSICSSIYLFIYSFLNSQCTCICCLKNIDIYAWKKLSIISIHSILTHVAKGAQESHPSFWELSSLTRRGSLVLQGTAEPEVDEHHGRCSLGAGVATLPRKWICI